MNRPAKTSQRLLRRKLWRLITTPLVLWPTLIGGAGTLLSGIPEGPLSWAMLAILAVGLGTAAYRWLADQSTLNQQALADWRDQARRDHLAYLNRLRRNLRTDRDPRTNQLARQLQQLYDRMSQIDPHFASEGDKRSPAMLELFEQTQNLYQSCLSLLEKSLHLWRTARNLSTESARNQMLESREKLIQEVEISVKHLEATVDRLQTSQLERRDLGDAENARLRDELQQGLTVARQVEQRMEELERDLAIRERI